MADPFPNFPCPKCGASLAPSGVLTIDDGADVPVYQCDECVVMGKALGIEMEMALTFYVDADGRAINPTAPDEPFSAN